MHYKFPEICTIDDVLPYVEDREEFIIADVKWDACAKWLGM